MFVLVFDELTRFMISGEKWLPACCLVAGEKREASVLIPSTRRMPTGSYTKSIPNESNLTQLT